MKTKNKIAYVLIAGSLVAGGCTREESPDATEMRFEAVYPNASRVTETAFEEGDRVGVFVKKHGSPLEASGNQANNEPLTQEGGVWTARRTLYWEEGSHDIVGYYPYREEVESVDDLPFAIALDQSEEGRGEEMGGYEASDFLWASREGAEQKDGPVELRFAHRMSKLVVRLVPGDDYEGDIPEDARVYVHNTVPEATIDLSVGLVTKDAYASAETIEAKKEETGKYAAIVVPQRLDNQVPLIEIVVEGVSYMVERKFVFKQGIQHTVNVTLAKNPDQVKIEIGGEIEDWD